MTNLTTENAGELLQPIFDGLAVQIKEQVTGLLGASDSRLEKLEKASVAEPEVELDLKDADAVEAHLKTLKETKSVDMTDRAAVEAHLATMEKASPDADEKDKEIEALKKDLAKAQRGSNLRQDSTDLIEESTDMYDDDEAFLADLNSDLKEA